MSTDNKQPASQGSGMKALAKDTAIYGLSSIVGRFLNYLLVPLYTAKLAASTGGYGVITEVYSYVALLLVLLTFGMETTFFRFVNKGDVPPQRVYSTTLLMVGGVGVAFLLAVFGFLTPIAAALDYADHPEFLGMMAVCVAIDAFQCIPFAYLRYQRRPIKFASLKLLFIVLNITLNLVFFLLLPWLYEQPGMHAFIAEIYSPDYGVGYAFAINLFCTALITLFFRQELSGFRWTFDRGLARRMWHYAWPILVLGIAGILNQTADKMIFPRLVEGQEGKVQLGIYGASVKIAMIMAMITQAFRYAYEPFVFGRQQDKDNRATYAKAMKFFLIFTLLAFLLVMGYIDILKHIIGRSYWPGLKVVPIVMAAEIMMGVYFNLSFWYKLIDKTIWGAWFSGAGCAVLIAVNVLFIPTHGYMACAWAGFAGYATAMTLSYVVGQRYYPIQYPLKSIAVYVVVALFFFGVMQAAAAWVDALWLRLLINTACILLFVAHIVHYDFPLSSLPVVGKWFRK
ncbi:MAG: lipopolysaccharide biosynthesis protein [Bacteroidales bacterium]|nr:lipopolysaccharide biosynthesis protein [Bacteroidales bacterium]